MISLTQSLERILFLAKVKLNLISPSKRSRISIKRERSKSKKRVVNPIRFLRI